MMRPFQIVMMHLVLLFLFHASGFPGTKKHCEMTALLEYFYNLLTVLLELINPTIRFP